MADAPSERIYVGGLDPARGLTVDLVATRLRAIKGVAILSIDDAHSKRTIIDSDGDVVDTRNFFYVEARATDAKSALDVVAKQYHGVKWKGCQLRVEAARPHFLHRLEEERALRAAAAQKINDLQVDDAKDKSKEKEVVKQRRRLRIRKRFGEEAYHVDTHPHPLHQAANVSLWGDFATLHERMTNKRASQQKKLMERRREERRAWASGKGNHRAEEGAEGGDLNGLIFLNRGIHIRFDAVGGEGGESEGREAAEPANRVGEESESAASSSVVSSDSDDSSENQMGTKEAGQAYVWSDEDDDDDGHNGKEEESRSDVSSEESAGEKRPAEGKYGLSDEEDGSSENEEQIDQQLEAQETQKGMDETQYTKAATMDEFSGGMDFGDASNDDDALSSGSEDHVAKGDGEDASENCIKDGDISSNLDILSRLFPGERFDQRPLVASIADDGGNGDTGTTGAANSYSSKPLFGAGMIMQRYDPTKESDKRFEMPSVEENSAHATSGTGEDRVGKDDGEKDEGSDEGSAADDASVSSESSDGNAAAEQAAKEDDTSNDKPAVGTDVTKSRTATNVKGKVVPAKDVYEQDKLEDIFKSAREGKTESFSLASLFQSGERATGEKDEENDVYEQDKLENVFKQAREGGSAGSGSFSFGFQSQLPKPSAVGGTGTQFSFGFDASNTSDNAAAETLGSVEGDRKIGDQPDEALIVETPKKDAPKRKRRRGMTFPESDLDKYEALFFSLNEGPQIIQDFQAMKHDEKSQEQWQKERAALTADWKRKQKAALSRGTKKQRKT